MLKVEPGGGGGDIPRCTIRRCRIKGVHLERNEPPETADGTTAPAAEAKLEASGASNGGIAPMFTPPPPDFGLGRPAASNDRLPASCTLAF